MGFTTATLTLLFIFAVVPSNAQLNYEGNPLTENTEYTAEETQSVERNSRANQLENTDTVLVNNAPQKLYPVYAKDAKTDTDETFASNNSSLSIEKSVEIDSNEMKSRSYDARNLADNSLSYNLDTLKNDIYIQPQQNFISDYALNSFLQSKTPEESKVALDYYIQSQENLNQLQNTAFSQSSQIQPLQSQSNSDLIQQGLPYQSAAVDFLKTQNQFNQSPDYQPATVIVQPGSNVDTRLSFQPNGNFQSNTNVNYQSNPSVSIQPSSNLNFQSNPTVSYQSNIDPQVSNFPPNPAPAIQNNGLSNYQSDSPAQSYQYQANMQAQTHPTQVQSQSNYQFQPSPNLPSNSLTDPISHPAQMQTYPNQNPPRPMIGMYQARVPIKSVPSRYSRHQNRPVNRMRNKFPQQRVSPSFMYKNPPSILPQNYPPPPIGMGKNKGPVEVIYTKPPGYRAPIRHTPPGPYEEASSWYPETNRLPTASPKDIYWSQLYTQSYDPHYYNYIAKTGKIKPHLYGKLQNYNKDDDSIWGEMVKGFKKHGLKNIMNPGFLLGMTIPALTLMLTALVQKRSFARADFGPLTVDEEKLNEYMVKLQKALQAYDEKKQAGFTRQRR